MLKGSCASVHVKCSRIHPPMGVWQSAGPVSVSDLWWTALCPPDAWRYDDGSDVGALLSHLAPGHWQTTAPPWFSSISLCFSQASSCLNTATCWTLSHLTG